MWKCLEIYILGASPRALELFFLGFPESGLGVYYTPSPDELEFLVAGQLMGGHTHAYQAFPFQGVDLVDQGSHLRDFEWSHLFTPGSFKLRESAYVGGEAGFMILAVEPCSMPSPERFFKGRSRKPARGWVWRPTPL
jgi:hypothetical protein